jgi:hypothetical protein
LPVPIAQTGSYAMTMSLPFAISGVRDHLANIRLPPVFHFLEDCGELSLDNLDRLPTLSLFKSFPSAKNNLETSLESSLGLLCNQGIEIAEQCASLRVADDDPGNTGIFELGSADFSGECTRRLRIAVLSRRKDLRSKGLTNAQQVKCRRCDDHL